MPLSIRLDPNTRAALERVAKATGRSRSDIVREALSQHLKQLEVETPKRSAYDRLAKCIGAVDSGHGELSRNTGRRFRAMLEARRARRSG